MKNKLVLLSGVAVGYVLGARAGREQYDRIREQAMSLWGDPRVQEQVSGAQSVVKKHAPAVQERAAGVTRSVVDRATSGGRRDVDSDGPGGGI